MEDEPLETAVEVNVSAAAGPTDVDAESDVAEVGKAPRSNFFVVPSTTLSLFD